ncbi:MAG: mobile mystery protein A [Candidatus Aegiribacteria sp.]|nr:mobile mystery protein A [Candidatus Aegiribacteria sp.]
MKTNNKLVREQLQITLAKFQPMLAIPIPPKGWIRAVRNALGMSGRQLAERMGVTKQRVSIIEKREIDASVTLKTLRRAAEAVECVFVYAIVPRTSLEEITRNRAQRVAGKRLARASHTMKLENQALGKKENMEILSNMIEEIMDKLPSNLWDE